MIKYKLFADPDYIPDQPTIKMFNEIGLEGVVIPTSRWSEIKLDIFENGKLEEQIVGNKSIQKYLNNN